MWLDLRRTQRRNQVQHAVPINRVTVNLIDRLEISSIETRRVMREVPVVPPNFKRTEASELQYQWGPTFAGEDWLASSI